MWIPLKAMVRRKSQNTPQGLNRHKNVKAHPCVIAVVTFCWALSAVAFGQNGFRDDSFHPTVDKSAKTGVYVPKDLDDALNELDKGLGKKFKEQMRAKRTQDDMVDYHMGFGMWNAITGNCGAAAGFTSASRRWG